MTATGKGDVGPKGDRPAERASLMRGPMPSYRLIRDFLPASQADKLLAWAIDNELQFEPTVVGSDGVGRLDPTIRVSASVSRFGPLKQELRDRMLEIVPALIDDLGVSPTRVTGTQLELVAHNDGALYARHLDTLTGADKSGAELRILSGVYYIHKRPKGFEGGTLRLYRFGAAGDGDFVEIEPLHNALLVFPSWAMHEVTPVSCPSKDFARSRFAVNIWILSDYPAPRKPVQT